MPKHTDLFESNHIQDVTLTFEGSDVSDLGSGVAAALPSPASIACPAIAKSPDTPADSFWVSESWIFWGGSTAAAGVSDGAREATDDSLTASGDSAILARSSETAAGTEGSIGVSTFELSGDDDEDNDDTPASSGEGASGAAPDATSPSCIQCIL